MPSPVNSSYACASGAQIAGGRTYVPTFDSVSIFSEDSGVPYNTAGQTFILELHGSGGQNYVSGRQYRAVCSGKMAYGAYTTYSFYSIRTIVLTETKVAPNDKYGTWESMHFGYKNMGDAYVHLISLRRFETLLNWIEQNMTNLSPTKRCLTGGSMGGWGTLLLGLRKPTKFGSLYPDRPRWRYDATVGEVAVVDIVNGFTSVTVASAPNLAPEDGGGSVATRMDAIAYVSNTANKIAWIGWCVGRLDGYTPFSDHVAAVSAMRTAKRGFAFVWNNGNHSGGSVLNQITSSYPFGLFEIGKGYPLFTNHSGDQDPAVDLVGGINEGLTFRNVVESAGAWSCEVTSVLGARTVTVQPISNIFLSVVTPVAVTITAANAWTAVSF